MKWLKKLLKNWINSDQYIEVCEKDYIASTVSSHDSSLRGTPLRLNIYYASGGVIIETRMYDEIKDREHTRLHIIHSDQDMSEELSKIITMETLRNT